MTKAFLEPIVLKPENENIVRISFSKKRLDRVKLFNARKRNSLKIWREKYNEWYSTATII